MRRIKETIIKDTDQLIMIDKIRYHTSSTSQGFLSTTKTKDVHPKISGSAIFIDHFNFSSSLSIINLIQ